MTEDNPLQAISDHLGDIPVAPATGIAAMALTLAMKYHDINTVQDGTLYQQYKLEGKNMTPLHLDAVFETAMKMEAYLMGASERIAKLIVDAVAGDDPEPNAPAEPEPEAP